MDEREMVSAERARAVIELHEAAATGTKDITVAVTTLAAQAPDLARTVIALHAIIEGRTVAPTDAELAAHAGAWLMRLYNGALVAMHPDGAREARGVMVRDVPYVAHWIATTSDGRPCAWPVASQRPAGCICDFRDGKHRFSCLRQQPTVAVARGEDGAFRVAGTEVDRGK